MENKIIYHYCDIETFKTIIEKKTLRFSDITKSNDSAELRFITRYLDNVFESEIMRIRENGDYESISSIKPETLFQKFKEAYFDKTLVGTDKTFWFYTSCFSLKNDSLSQWRGYADDGQGFCIGFDSEYFKKFNNNGFDLLSIKSGLIEYNKEQQEAEVKACIGQFVQDLIDLARDNALDMTIATANYMRCFQTLLGKAVFMKNHFFYEEEEWRMSFMYFDIDDSPRNVLLIQNGKPITYPIEYRKSKDKLVSYFDLVWEPVAVKTIILGPKNHSDLSDINMFIKDNEINCNVRRSDGTYI